MDEIANKLITKFENCEDRVGKSVAGDKGAVELSNEEIVKAELSNVKVVNTAKILELLNIPNNCNDAHCDYNTESTTAEEFHSIETFIS